LKKQRGFSQRHIFHCGNQGDYIARFLTSPTIELIFRNAHRELLTVGFAVSTLVMDGTVPHELLTLAPQVYLIVIRQYRFDRNLFLDLGKINPLLGHVVVVSDKQKRDFDFGPS